eukprot:Skav224879  [mRNA]  locus=scaffold1112:216130:228109:+ [translate_table: standard]
MSLDWSDRDLLEWAQRTLPEFLLMCMQDTHDRKQSIALTPWSEYELSVAEVQLEGEVNLIGRKNEPMLQFDLDLGMRVDVEKKVSPPVSDDEDDFDNTAADEFVEGTFERKRKGAPQNMKKFGRYPPVSDDEDDFDNTAPYEFVEGTFERKRKGAPQNMKKFGRYPFMPSMLAGRSSIPLVSSHELLRMVLEARADPDARDSFGQTPLMMAAKQGDQEAAQVLLDAGADAAATDSLGRAASDMVKEEHNPLKNWREKMSGQPLPEDPAKKSRDLKVLIDSKEKPKKFGLSLLSALAQKDVRTAEAAMEAGADMKLEHLEWITWSLRRGSGYWSSENWDPDSRVYTGADIFHTHHLAVQPDGQSLPEKPQERQEPQEPKGAQPGLRRSKRPGGKLQRQCMPCKQMGKRRGDSSAYWGAMDDDLDASTDLANLGIQNVSLARSAPAKKVSFDGGYQVSSEGPGTDRSQVLRRGSSDYWTSGNWNLDQRGRQQEKPKADLATEELDTPSTQSGSASARCLPRKDSNAYWDADQWDPDERIYVGAEAGQMNHRTAVIRGDDKLMRAWSGGLTCSGQPSGPVDILKALDSKVSEVPELQDLYDVETDSVGFGSFGVVKKATHRETGTRCVVKSLKKAQCGQLYKSQVENGLYVQLLSMSVRTPHDGIVRYTLFTGDCPVQPEQMQTLALQSPAAEAIIAEALHRKI